MVLWLLFFKKKPSLKDMLLNSHRQLHKLLDLYKNNPGDVRCEWDIDERRLAMN